VGDIDGSGAGGAREVNQLIGVGMAFVGPLFADAGPFNAEAGPTWTLAGACALFLGALAWAIRNGVIWGRDGASVLYTEVIRPLAAAQRELMETLKETRENDSEALKSLAADVHELNRNIRCKHES
jgi:hypothetical protein